jgi:hypothetical protein
VKEYLHFAITKSKLCARFSPKPICNYFNELHFYFLAILAFDTEKCIFIQ